MTAAPQVPGNGAAPGPGVVAVRTEVAKEVLIDGLFERVMDRYPGDPPETVAATIDAVLQAILEREPAPDAHAGAREAAARMSRIGYLARVVETETFPAAREPITWLTGALRERGARSPASWFEVAREVSGELARREPVEKPRPDDEQAASWRVPGPGGHVRHYLALRAVGGELEGGEPATPGVAGLAPDDLKRAWMYGFYVRCCEESLPAHPPPAPGQRHPA